MKAILFALLVSSLAQADTPMPAKGIQFAPDGDIVKAVETYARATGEKFIVDPNVKGRASILMPTPLDKEEAFNQLSSALAVNGLAISKQGDTYIVQQARNIQRSLLEVGTQLPPLKPERQFTWVVTLKHVTAQSVNRNLRILSSKDGELVPNEDTNQIIITDWVSNLYRVSEILKQIDRPIDAQTTKLVNASRRDNEERERAINRKKTFKSE